MINSMLKLLAGHGDISELSLYFAEFIAAQSDQPIDSLLAFSAALVSEANQQGHVCIQLEHFQSRPLFDSDRIDLGEIPIAPSLYDWQEVLLSSNCVVAPGRVAPLILEDGRLYLYRYWYYENELAAMINTRLDNIFVPDKTTLVSALQTFYPDLVFNHQQLAVALAVRHRFAVISGGPGTGKTTTVINILSVLLSQQNDMRIQLTAPTGKAAARLIESIRQGMDDCRLDASMRSLIPSQASTIHRLLGYRRDGFRYSRRHRLPVDCLVIDEASMVDLTLMYHLLDALPAQTRVILLGDRDQLASVSAGNILGDITGKGVSVHYSSAQIEWLNTIFELDSREFSAANSEAPLADSIALLTHSYRFNSQSGIGTLAQLVNAGESHQAIDLLRNTENPLQWYHQQTETFDKTVLTEIITRYQQVINASSIEQAFKAFDSYRILCAVQNGPFGVVEINRRIEALMRTEGGIESHEDFHCKPLLIQSNDYDLELFNGNIGLLWRDSNNHLYAYFRDMDEKLRRFPVNSLPAHSSAWAMTVHKSQGSEFGSVLLVLPEQGQKRVLSRELLYTGITRARQQLSIYASSASLEFACSNRSQRYSGLSTKLGWPDNPI